MLSKIVLCLLALIVGLLGSSLLELWPQGPTAGFGSEAHAASVSPFADSEDFTFVAWVYWEGGPDWQRIFEFSRDAERNMYLTPSSNADKLRFAITASGDVNEQQLNASEPLPKDQWVHVAVTLAGDSGQLYLNGVIVDSGTITLNPNQVTGSQRWLAKSQYNWDPTFKGRLDEVAVFDRALSQSEIQQIMASGWDSLTGQTLALHLDENPATGMAFITDSSGQENYVRLFTLDEENKSVPGKEGQALLFDGVNDYVALSPNRLVPDVNVQFNQLQTHGDPMGFRLKSPLEDTADPTLYNHYQGIARFDDSDGTPYLFLTRNQTQESPGVRDYRPGELLVVKMESRTDRHGERLRSNRLGPKEMGETLPSDSDRGVKAFYFNGLDFWPQYEHPGGMQIVGDVLVVPLQDRCRTFFEDDPVLGPARGDCHNNNEKVEGALALLDVSNPEDPKLIYFKDFYGDPNIDWGEDQGLGVVGVTYVYKGEHERTADGGKYLFILTWGGADEVRFAWSDSADLKQTTDLVLEPFTWNDADQNGEWKKWQTLNFVRDENGTLYVIGLQKDPDNWSGVVDDWIGLFEVDVSKLTSSTYQQAISFVANGNKQLNLGDPPKGSLAAASGVYVSPTGNLILYTGPHEDSDIDGYKYIEMGEFRNIDVYHPDTEAAKTMCPWAELYRDELSDTWPGISLMYDFQDRRDETSWYNLRDENFNDETSAIRWYLKPGQKLYLYKHKNFGGDICLLSGKGNISNLKDTKCDNKTGNENWNDRISSFFMGPFADPGGPYNGDEGSLIPLNAANLCYRDDEGTFEWSWPEECTGESTTRQPTLSCPDNVSFQATLTVLDNITPWPGGLSHSATRSTSVTFNNVAPLVTAVGTIDENRLATVSGTITDPGTLDTFDLTIDWGDGAVGPFPYPAGTTTYSTTHQYQITTLEVHTVTVTVEDKDGGIGTASTSINVEGGEPIYLPLIIKDSQ